jgi:hypothetical protein
MMFFDPEVDQRVECDRKVTGRQGEGKEIMRDNEGDNER